MGVTPRPDQSSFDSIGVSRLAPSPTGALHLGNARTFLVNWAIARTCGWTLRLRIEDFDTPRVKAGATASILDTLRWLGIDWNAWDEHPSPDDCFVQSSDVEPYREAMRLLARSGLAYPCVLTRAEIEAAASAPQAGSHEVGFPASMRPPDAAKGYDFDALNRSVSENARPNWRFVVAKGALRFDDRFAGPRSYDPSEIVGDFVLWTKRDQPSYQLAVVVDDHRQGVTEIIRGDDLLDSASRQLLLYRALGYTPEPSYAHLPLVIGEDGRRLAKRHGDTRIEYYREKGVTAEAIIGLIARWCGVTPTSHAPTIMTARGFMKGFDLSKMSSGPVVFSAKDNAWLLSTVSRRATAG